MAMRIIEDYGPQSFIATAYQSNTANVYFGTERCTDIAGLVRLGTVTGSGQVDWTVGHAIEDPNAASPAPDWVTLIQGSGNLAATSAVETIFRASALQNLFPYGRLQIIAKNSGASSLTVADLVAKIVAEVK